MANKDKEPKKERKFFKEFKAELKRVIWLKPKQLINNTAAVVVIVIITATIVFGLDFAFELLNKYGINKIKSNVKGVSVEQNENNSETEEFEIDNIVFENGLEGENTTVDENNMAEDNVVSE